MIIPPTSSGQLLEVTYFDARFREGLFISGLLLVVVIAMIVVGAKKFPLRAANPRLMG